MHVNGRLTINESIADLGGVLVALDAYHRSLGGSSAPVLDGLSGAISSERHRQKY
jgi:putative endopeptidase